MKKTRYILWAIALITAVGCEDLDVLEDDANNNVSPFSRYGSSISDDAKHPVAIFSDMAIILDLYHNYYNYTVQLEVDGLQVSTSRDFQSIDKAYSSDDLIQDGYYWKVEGLKPRTTYYYRYFSDDKLGGRGYSDTFSFTTNDIKLNEVVEVKELSPTYVSIQAKWDNSVTSVDNIIGISFSVIQGSDTLRLSGIKQEGADTWEADFPLLSPNTTYKLETKVMFNVMRNNSSYAYTSSYSLPLTTSTTFTTPKHEAMDFVDLGIEIKWATCNLGATKPEQTGGYYTYPSSSESVAGTSLDVVTNALGVGYRMPTKDELQQLCDYCMWNEEVVNGVKGMRCTGTNGNSIFFPYTGYISYFYTSPDYYSSGGSSLSDKSTLNIYSGSRDDLDYIWLTGSNGNVTITNLRYNHLCMPIRPVSTITY